MFLFALAGLLCLFGILGLFLWDLSNYADSASETSGNPQITTVSPGQDLETTSEILDKIGIIRKPGKFELLARLRMLDRRIKAGEYLLSPAMTPSQILEIMTEGKVFLHKVTIPEGYNIYQIAAVLGESGLVSEKNFVKAAADSTFARNMGIEALCFEGYLFPETYFFEKNVSSREIIRTMVERFRKVFNPLWERRPDDFPFSAFETIILASLIEKETGDPEERMLISSVFHNRLRNSMRLESDPTVIYGIDNFDGNLTRKHLRAPTDYNTYTKKGLPVGPITNPGKASLEAAIFPEETSYLYFVSKNGSSHHFSTNYDEHRRAVRKYQIRGLED